MSLYIKCLKQCMKHSVKYLLKYLLLLNIKDIKFKTLNIYNTVGP